MSVESTEKRSVIRWSDEQYERLQAAAERLGLSVPAYVRVKALESVAENNVTSVTKRHM